MPLLGAHMSIAGGFYKAADAAAEFGCDTVQIFTSAPGRWPVAKAASGSKKVVGGEWAGKPLAEKEIDRFRTTIEGHGLTQNCSHASYLINLGTPDDELWGKSIAALVVEVNRASQLGLSGVVLHPGAHVDSGEEAGLARVAAGLDEVHRQTDGATAEVWLEVTAGQGTCLGHRFEHIAHAFDHVEQPDRMGVCIDTCHLFAAGYPLVERKDYLATMRDMESTIGLERIRAFHLNDSKKPLGSRVDRHDHIGEGEMGLEPFRHVLNDKRFRKLPMFIETKKEDRDGEAMDAVNLRTLRSLLGSGK